MQTGLISNLTRFMESIPDLSGFRFCLVAHTHDHHKTSVQERVLR